MRESKTPRVVAAAFLGLLFGAYKHFQQVRELAAGRQAFLAQQNLQFDRITRTHSMTLTLVAGLILAFLGAALYEAIAYVFARLIPPVEVEE